MKNQKLSVSKIIIATKEDTISYSYSFLDGPDKKIGAGNSN